MLIAEPSCSPSPLAACPPAAARRRPARPGRRPARPDLPASPGTAPAFVPPGAPAAIPDTSGPGLLERRQRPRSTARKRTFAVRLACQGDGTLRVRAARLAASDLARTRYRCAAGRATASSSSRRKVAKRLARRRSVAATGIVARRPRRARHFELTAGRASPRRRRASGPTATSTARPGFLVEPDFTATAPIPISTRGWVAWYTAATGWHWLGSAGENAGRWNTWTATVSGRRSSSTRTAPPSRCRGRSARSPSRPGAASTPSASTRSSTGSAGAPTTSGSTSTRARPARSPPGAANPLLRVPVKRASSPAAPGSSARTSSTRCSRAGDDVTVLDDLSTGPLGEPRRRAQPRRAPAHRRASPTRPRSSASFAAARPDAVFHLAAQIDVRHAVADPARDATVNLIGTVTLLEAARRHGVERVRAGLDRRRDLRRRRRGPHARDRARRAPARRTPPPRPRPRATSSSTGELHGLSTLSLRLANVYGPRQARRRGGRDRDLLRRRGRRARPVTIFGDGGQTRDFVYVGDVVEAFLAAGESARTGCCNIATGPRDERARAGARRSACGTRFAPARVGRGPPLLPGPAAAAARGSAGVRGRRSRRAGPDAHQHGSRSRVQLERASASP